jgi:hypothetical protein
VATIAAVTTRVLRDFWAVSHVRPPLLLPLALASPLGVVLLTAAVVLVRYDVPFTLIWHLLTRT